MSNDWGAVLALFYTIMGALIVGYVLVSLLMIIPTWRILRRAGFAGALALLHLVPVVGPFVVLAILAFGTWPAGEAPPPPRRIAT